ncbi:MAG TPA: bifunctional oligoribonuclease/PAP phosphatase NrnA [Verrucomicrobiales bacterium]|jgi:phosphoesterase RecJ-like protein|nr:bifunctional oligoribonuclease/PAP phosphatase NrnA [Verrucomicrobiales bacterium]
MPLRTNTSLEEIARCLQDGASFVVLSHYRPDGDAIGSTLAVALALKKMGKSVRVLNEDPVPETLRFLPGSELLEQPGGETITADAVIAVDCATRERLGAKCLAALNDVPLWINIDHHRSNEDYGRLHFIDSDAPATGEIVFNLLSSAGLPLDRDIGSNLYVAISTDTGSFQYQGTTARTYEIGAELIRLGVDISQLARDTYENHPMRRIELLRGLLNTMQITHGGRVASWALTQELAAATQMKPEDAEGLIDTLRGIQGVIVAAAFEELPGPEGKIRLSLRSKDPRVDVGKVCAVFGGGGHALAAGARLKGPLTEATTRVFHAIDEALPPA